MGACAQLIPGARSFPGPLVLVSRMARTAPSYSGNPVGARKS